MKKSTRLSIETLEDRNLMATFGVAWPDAGHLKVSFVPDGTNVDGFQSGLFQKLGATASTKAWEMEVLRALQTWAVQGNVNIGVVSDGGQALGATGPTQGDTRFGDIRVAARAMTNGPLALASPYDPVAGTRAGDVVFNSSQPLGIGSSATNDLYTVALHEAGHVFGLDHSDDQSSAMYESYQGARSGLSQADIGTLQSLYGARSADRYEGSTGDDTFGTAAAMKLANIAGDITTLSDVDFYKFKVPSYANRSITVKVHTAGLSLLTPRLTIYNATQQVVATTSATDPLSGDISITLNNVKRGTVFYFKVQGARSDVFGMGGYRLKVDSGSVSQAQIAAIDKLLNATSESAIDDHHTNDTQSTATRLDQATYGLDPRFNYSVNATLGDTNDVDFYSVTAPTGGTAALLFTVTAGQGSVLNPEITVYDAQGNAVDAEILSNDAGSFVVQVVNPVAGAKYFVQVSPDAFAASGDMTGNYLLGVEFRSAAIVLDTLVDDTLSATNTVDVYTLQSSEVQLYHFVMAVDTGGEATDIAVRMQIFDANNHLVLTLDCHDGETISANLALNQGAYTARFVAASRTGAVIPDTAYQLLGVSVSDPLDPVAVDPTDPTLPPPSDPGTVVVTNPPTNPTLPPVDPTSNPWTPPPPPYTI